MYSMYMHESFLSRLKFWVSRNFPKIAWQAFKVVRRLMLFLCCFWVPEAEPPSGMILTARRRIICHPVSGFCFNGLAVMNTRQATRVRLTRFSCFWCSGMILFGKEGSLYKGGLRSIKNDSEYV